MSRLMKSGKKSNRPTSRNSDPQLMDDKERIDPLLNNNVSICTCYLHREGGLWTKEIPEVKSAEGTPIGPRALIPCSEYFVFP